MYTVLSTRRLLFESTPERLVYLAKLHGFDAVDAPSDVFLDERARDRLVHLVREGGLRWGLAGMPAPLGTKTDDERFTGLLSTLEVLAPELERAGVTTMSAWLAPANDEAGYDETFELHRRRLDAIAPVLAESGLRLALEYVGPATWRSPYRHRFISSLAEMRSLIAELADPSRFGLLLDSFHWYTAGEGLDDVRRLSADEVLAVDLNDAPAGPSRDDQDDMERAQPGATGVIDVAGFVQALRAIGYDGPVQSEPFSASLRVQPEQERVAEARAALAAVGL